jgi:formylglycine-generating enzyme required for sulfatase activity
MLVLWALIAVVTATAEVHAWPNPTPRISRDCLDCPEIVVLEGGTFLMGAPEDDASAFAEERPVHKVTLRPFAISRYEITRAEWAAFVTETKHTAEPGCDYAGRAWHERGPSATWRSLGFPQTDRHPVVCVTWRDAQDYTAWLSRKTGKRYRLPTEAEWEFAARARSTTRFPWGNDASRNQANFGKEKCCGPAEGGADRWQATAPVGSFAPNAFGLYDMHGNVLEWVQDCFAPDYRSTPRDGSAYRTDVVLETAGDLASLNGKRSCDFRVLRGGDWGSPPEQLRSSFRNWGPPEGALSSFRSGGVGFRVARDP